MPSLLENKLVARIVLWVLLLVMGFLNIVNKVLSFDYRNNKKYIFLSITIAYAAMIFYLSSRSDIQVPTHIFKIPLMYAIQDFLEGAGIYFVTDLVEYAYLHKDKVAHMFLYFGLGVFLHMTFRHSDNPVMSKYAAPFAFIVGILYGISDEIHQTYVPGRTGSVNDVLANGLGLLLAQIILLSLILWGLQERRKRKHKKESTD
jgi:VanZ family protein